MPKIEFNTTRLNDNNPSTWNATLPMHKNDIPTFYCAKCSNQNRPCRHLCTELYFVNWGNSDVYSVHRKI